MGTTCAASPRHSTATEVVINALHHNPHWECFENDPSGKCMREARKLFNGLLVKYDIDFASLVMGYNYSAPAGYSSLTSTSDVDKAVIVYNPKKWKIEDSMQTEFVLIRA